MHPNPTELAAFCSYYGIAPFSRPRVVSGTLKSPSVLDSFDLIRASCFSLSCN